MTNKELSITPKTIAPVIAVANGLDIVDTVSMKVAVEFLSEANKYLDSVIEWKEKKTKPLNEALKVIRAETKPMESALTEAIESVREKMTTYQTEQVRLQKIAQEKIADRVSKGTLKIETGVRKLGEIAVPEKEVATDAGLVQFAEVKCFEVMDITLLPIEYHLANEVEIRKAMKEGKEVAGVRYYVEMQPRNYR